MKTKGQITRDTEGPGHVVEIALTPRGQELVLSALHIHTPGHRKPFLSWRPVPTEADNRRHRECTVQLSSEGACRYLAGLGEDLFEEVFHGPPGAAVGGFLELGTHLRKVGVRHSEGMHGAAVVDDLPVRDARVS